MESGRGIDEGDASAMRREDELAKEEDDILQRKKAMAHGPSLEGLSSLPISPILSYCAASIMMTVINKVCYTSHSVLH